MPATNLSTFSPSPYRAGTNGGAEGWAAAAQYGRAKRGWLKTFLQLPHGIASQDTFADVFAKLPPEAFARCFMPWMQSMVQPSGSKLVALDGKSLRLSFPHGWDKSGMAHMVSAFVQANNSLGRREVLHWSVGDSESEQCWGEAFRSLKERGLRGVPAPHRLKLGSTNMVESMMKRLRKRTRVVGIFPNRSSCQRLIGSRLLELHEQWQAADERYLNLEYAGA